MGDRKIRKKDCVRLSNKIIERCQLDVPSVAHISDIRSNLFVSLLGVLSHDRLPPGIVREPTSAADEVRNVQAIVDHLALDLINVDLSHITGEQVMAGDPRAIYNLLEIFCGLHKYLSSHEMDKWHLEESLTETEEELSSTGSSSDTPPPAPELQDDPASVEQPADAAEKPPKTPP